MATIDGQFVCDVCKEVFPAEKTCSFAHEGSNYEVDLCAPHVRKLATVLNEFIVGGRLVGDA